MYTCGRLITFLFLLHVIDWRRNMSNNKRQPKYSKTLSFRGVSTPHWGGFRFERGMMMMDMYSMLMVDWDPVEEGVETDHHYTVHCKQEVFDILAARVKACPDELWRVYETPSGGIHAFLLSHSITTEEGYGIVTEMKGDLLYRDYCRRRGMWAVRVTPKVGRQGDYVARFLCHYGSGQPLPLNVKAIRIHDSHLLGEKAPGM